MSKVRSSIDKQRARPSEMNVDVPEKPDESITAEQTKTAVKVVEPQNTARKQRDEKLDNWMENIKEFIRNIDVKSL
jgi:hypothetical protein